MTTRQVFEWLTIGSEDLDRLLAPAEFNGDVEPYIVHVMHRLFDARPALPGAQAFDSDRVSSSSSHSNPPPGFDQADAAISDRDEAHRRAKRFRDDMDWFIRLGHRTNPRSATAKDRQLTALNERGERGCESCQTVGHWSPLEVQSSTVKGTLPEPMGLCKPCYRHVLKYGRLPSRRQLEDARDKGAWKEPA